MTPFLACSVRALVLAPTGRDARLIVALLADVGVVGDVCQDAVMMASEMAKGAAFAILAEEAVREVDLTPMSRVMAEQGEWSDLPVILLTHRGGVPGRDPELMRIASVLGNVNFLERPFHTQTLTSMVYAASRNRHRQYELRDRMDEIAQREHQLQTAMVAGRLGAWSLLADGRQLTMSKISCAHFGRHPECAFTFDDLTQAMHGDEQARWVAGIDSALSTGKDYSGEFLNCWPDHTEHWVDLRARPLTDAEGRVVELVGMSADITARKIAELERERLMSELSGLTRTLEQRVEQRTAQLNAETAAREKTQLQLLQVQKMESVGQLTGGIAHDFNNLLMAIMGSLEVLKRRVPDDATVQRLIAAAMQGATRGASLTQRMLAFARQQELRTTSADLADLLTGMQELLQRSIGPQIELRLSIAPDLPPAEVDAHQVELAVLNLAINARDAMPEGGVIDVVLDLNDADSSTPTSAPLAPGHYLRIRVIDSGTGMDAETLAKAVEPFFSTKPAGRGTGLGLSMIHGLAKQLGGMLLLESETGHGTTASLLLPVAAKAVEPVVAHAERVAVKRSAKILIVDDDPLVATSTVDMLVDLGHSVKETHSAERAIKILEAGEEIDLVVTDHAMPGMTGTELAKVIRVKRPGLPVLLVSGYTELPASELAHLPRLAKPYQQADLQAAIDSLLSHS